MNGKRQFIAEQAHTPYVHIAQKSVVYTLLLPMCIANSQKNGIRRKTENANRQMYWQVQTKIYGGCVRKCANTGANMNGKPQLLAEKMGRNAPIVFVRKYACIRLLSLRIPNLWNSGIRQKTEK